MNKIIASIQVRMNSNRLYGKVMSEVNGKPLLGYLIERLKKSKTLTNIIVSTSKNSENDVIEKYCYKNHVVCYRGEEEDVLKRTTEALKIMDADYGVQIYGDGPLISSEVVDFLVNKFFESDTNYDFMSNNLETSFPPGMEAEVFTISAIKDAEKKNKDKNTREHGTLFIRKNPHIYKIKNIKAPKIWKRPDLEIEVDTSEDLEVIRAIINNFRDSYHFKLEEIIKFLDENPELIKINSHIFRRWKKYRN